jgi:hypothetical protein
MSSKFDCQQYACQVPRVTIFEKHACKSWLHILREDAFMLIEFNWKEDLARRFQQIRNEA